MNFLKPLALFNLFAFATFLPIAAYAQTSTGQLSITVLDASGALVPRANISITGAGAGNVLRTLTSNGHGLANAPLIPPLIPPGNSGLQNAFLLDGARNENYLRGLDNRTRDMVRPPVDATVGGATYGIVTATSTNNRQLQFAIHIAF